MAVLLEYHHYHKIVTMTDAMHSTLFSMFTFITLAFFPLMQRSCKVHSVVIIL